jgi:multidrug transporter EmrE-like cation transporter
MFLKEILPIFVATSIAVIGDFFIKKATLAKGINEYVYMGIAIFFYALNAMAFYIIYKHMELSSIGVYYALFTIILFVITGVLFFGEVISKGEFAGIVLAVASIFLLAKFAA